MNFRQSEEVKENADFVTRSGTIIRHSNRFQRNTLNMISGLRGYLLTGEGYFIQAYDSASNENKGILKELPTLITDTSQRKRLEEIDELNNKWINSFALPLLTAKRLAGTSGRSLDSFNKLYKEKLTRGEENKINIRLQQKFREFSNAEYDTRDKRGSILSLSVQQTKKITFSLTLLSIIAGFSIVVFLAKSISGRIMKMVSMADSIAEGNYTVHMEDRNKDELSKLAYSLNHMARVLSENISLLKRKNEELDQFAHIVSHDLKAPLRGIDNVISWMEEDHSQEITAGIQEHLQLIKGRVSRSENLIKGILSYARIGKEVQVNEKVNLRLLVQEIVDNLATNASLMFIIQNDLPVIFSERLPLEQIFSNLIGNAVKYHNKPDGRISIYYIEKPASYEFFVEDNGPGISKNYHKKIFIIFQTLQERDQFESTGVGLAIVKKILDSRGEEIRLSSEPGKGSIFSFTWSKV